MSMAEQSCVQGLEPCQITQTIQLCGLLEYSHHWCFGNEKWDKRRSKVEGSFTRTCVMDTISFVSSQSMERI